MGRRRKGSRRNKWNVDFTGAKLNLICFKRWGILKGAGEVMAGNYVQGMNSFGDGTITSVITDSVTAAIGYRVKTLLAPKGVPLFKSSGGKIGL